MRNHAAETPNCMTVLQNLYTSVIWVNPSLQVCWVNTQTEQLLSVSQSRLIGLNILAILSATDQKMYEEGHSGDNLNPIHPNLGQQKVSAYGQLSPLAIQFATAKDYQQPFIEYSRHIVGVVHPLFANYSVTPVKQKQETYFLVELWGENRQSRIEKENRLQEQHEVAREMLRSVAHEVKNPLAGIRGAAQLLIKQTQRAQKSASTVAYKLTHDTGYKKNPTTIGKLTLPVAVKPEVATPEVANHEAATSPKVITHLNTTVDSTVAPPIASSTDDAAELDYNMMLVDAKKLTTYAAIVISETDRLTSLIGQLLGSNQLPQWEAVNIHEPLEHVLMLTQSQHPNVHLVRDYDLSLPELTADKNQLIQVFLNLVNNACAAMLEQDFSNCTADYQPTLRLITRIEYQHTLGSTYHRQVLKVCVHDNGAGIDPDLIERIFFPLVTGRANGTGLGLALVQEMVHRHCGAIEVKSAPNDTAFCLYLPFTQHSEEG